MTRRIFITGATGFVGKHLIRHLDSPGNEIYGTSFPHQPEEIPTTCLNRICYLDINREEDVFRLVDRTKPHWVFHLAAVSNVKYSWEHRRQTLESNIMGTLNVLEALRKYSPEARMLFVSSSNVYGDCCADSRRVKEDQAAAALSPYAYSKISGELLARFYSRVENLDVVITRTFPHTGPGQSPDFVCSDWARQIIRIEQGLVPPRLAVGNLDVERDYSDVRDVVEAYKLLMDSGRGGQIYNIGSGRGVPLKKILDILLTYSSKDIEVHVDRTKLRKTDIPVMIGDIEKINRETGWKPSIPLEKTLSDLLEYWRVIHDPSLS